MQCLSPTVEPNVRVHEIWLGVTPVSKKHSSKFPVHLPVVWQIEADTLPAIQGAQACHTFRVCEVSRSTARSLEHKLEAVAT